jgi:ABC-type dipeptide/oligopeptide/nickel transport system permease subunit
MDRGSRRRTFLGFFGLYVSWRLVSLGAGIGAALALKSAGWTFLPSVAVAVAVLLVTDRLLGRLVLLFAQRFESRRSRST